MFSTSCTYGAFSAWAASGFTRLEPLNELKCCYSFVTYLENNTFIWCINHFYSVSLIIFFTVSSIHVSSLSTIISSSNSLIFFFPFCGWLLIYLKVLFSALIILSCCWDITKMSCVLGWGPVFSPAFLSLPGNTWDPDWMIGFIHLWP